MGNTGRGETKKERQATGNKTSLSLCSDLLLDAAELCKCTSFACEIYGKCQIDDSGFIAKVMSDKVFADHEVSNQGDSGVLV